MSLWGMTSLFVTLTTVPELTLTDSDGLNGPELKAHVWHPCIACLIAIVAVPPAGAEDATAKATSPTSVSAAPRTVCLPCISLLLCFGYLDQCRQDVGGPTSEPCLRPSAGFPQEICATTRMLANTRGDTLRPCAEAVTPSGGAKATGLDMSGRSRSRGSTHSSLVAKPGEWQCPSMTSPPSSTS